MEVLENILCTLLKDEQLQISFPNLNCDLTQLLENHTVKLLDEILKILRDDTLDDPECFQKIEAIVEIFEHNGLSCGNRHDFG